MKELNRDELLDWLDYLKDAWSYNPKACLYKKGLVDQAYEQIKQLISQERQVDEKWIQEKTMEMIDIVAKGKILEAMSFIRSIVQDIQKPRITMEFVEKWEDKWTRRYHYSGIMIDEIKQMLKKAGCEVEE